MLPQSCCSRMYQTADVILAWAESTPRGPHMEWHALLFTHTQLQMPRARDCCPHAQASCSELRIPPASWRTTLLWRLRGGLTRALLRYSKDVIHAGGVYVACHGCTHVTWTTNQGGGCGMRLVLCWRRQLKNDHASVHRSKFPARDFDESRVC